MKNKLPIKDLIMIGGILAALVIFFHKFVFLGMVPLNSDWLAQNFYPWKAMGLDINQLYFNNDTDPVLYMYPIKFIAMKIMASGALPLWNPYILCGAPLWGNNFACPLNPLNFVFFLFDFAKAWGIFLMLQFAVAGLSTYIFLRELGCRRLGAGIAGLAYMLNITFVIWFQTMSYLGVYMWIPFVFYMIERTVKTRSLVVAFWCGLSFALFVWCGQIQLAAYSVTFSLAYLIFRAVQTGWGDRVGIKRYALMILIIALTALLYSLPELIAQSTNILNSTRTANRYGLSLLYPQMLVSFLSPYFYGMKYDGWDLGFGTYIFNRGLIRLSPPYIGILPIFLGVIGFFARKNRDKFFYLISSIGILAILLSFSLPVIYRPILKFIPFFGSVDHYTLTTIEAFSMADLAGWGMNALISDGINKRSCVKACLAVFFSIILIFLAISGLSYINAEKATASIALAEKSAPSIIFDGSHSLKSVYKFIEYMNMLKKENGALLLSKEALVPMVFSFISMVLIICLIRSGRKRIWQAGAFLFMACDLLYYGLAFPAYSSQVNTFPMTLSSEYIKSDKSLFRVLGYSDRTKSPKGDLYPPNTNILYGFYDIRGYENIAQTRWIYRFMMGDKTDEIVVERFNDYESKFLSFLNVKYLMSKSDISSSKWELTYDKEIKIYKNTKSAPRVFVTGAIRIMQDKEKVWEVMRDPSFDPSREAVIEDGALLLQGGLSAGEIYYPTIKEYKPNEIIIDAAGQAQGVLVLSDSFFPGWKVFVDGKERKVLKVDYAFRGVVVNKGDKIVRFIFRPFGIYESLYLCAGILLLMLAVSIRRMFPMRTCGY